MAMADIFEVDETKCVKCGACVRDCAFRALKMDDVKPRMAYPDRCMKCQHCLAVCPTGAVVFDGKRPEDSVPTGDLPLPSLESVENWMRTRRSVRRFAAEDVDRATLDRILAALGNAPTGCNARSLTFTCFPTRESMDGFRRDFISAIERHRDGTKLLPRWLAVPAIRLRKSEEDLFFRGASGMLIVSSDETAPGVATPREDVTIACAQFEMLANAAGIATCWCGFLGLVQKEVPELLEQTVGLRRTVPFYAMLFGRPAVRYARGVQRDSYARIDYR
jgi:Fe-S-cluster-containing hydrogenase component 2